MLFLRNNFLAYLTDGGGYFNISLFNNYLKHRLYIRDQMKRILLVRTDRVGDVVYITPMIREIKKAYPDAFIATLTQPHTKNLMLNNPYLDAAITDDLRKETFWKVVKELRNYKFTHGLLMMPTERAAYQMFWAGIKKRIGVGHKLYEVITGMLSVSRNNYVPLRHEADYCMDLARKLGVQTTNIQPEIYLSEDEKKEAEMILNKYGINKSHKIIIIHSGSLGSAPNWSEGKYFQLIKKILDDSGDPNIKILLTAREMSEEFISKTGSLNGGSVVNILKAIENLRDFIKVIGQADVFFAPSTGPLHIADALNIKTIGLYCHRPMSCAIHHGVLNQRSINIEVREEDCKKYCSADQNKCSIERSISVAEVASAILELLNKN